MTAEPMSLNEEQKAKFLKLKTDKYSSAFFGMVGNRQMQYDLNAQPLSYEECMKIALDQEITNDKTLAAIQQEINDAIDKKQSRGDDKNVTNGIPTRVF